MTSQNLKFIPGVRYNLFTGTQRDRPIGFLVDQIYYEGPRDSASGLLEGDVFYDMVRRGPGLAQGTQAGRLEGDEIIRNDGTRFRVVEAP